MTPPPLYRVYYGHDGGMSYCHTITHSLEQAKKDRDSWLASGGWGKDPETLKVWVYDQDWQVVYGEKAAA